MMIDELNYEVEHDEYYEVEQRSTDDECYEGEEEDDED